MGNCLETKLKAGVNNDNLRIFGKLKVKVTTDYENTESNTLFRITGGTKEYPSGVTPPDATHAYYGDYEMTVDNLYNITEIYCGKCIEINTNDLSHVNCSDGFACPSLQGNFSDLNGFKCSNFSIAGSNRAFDISEFLVVDTNYYVFSNCPNCTGTVESFGNKLELTSLQISGSNGIGGDLFELAKRQINAGRDECAGITMPYLNTNATGLLFNGESVQNVRHSSNKLSWTYNSETGVYTVSIDINGTSAKSATYQK